MNKKQREKYIRELAANPNPSTDDLLGVIGWDNKNYTPEEWKEISKEIGEWIRKDREKNKQKIEQICESMNSKAKAC